jgi:hypothetical protein
MKTVYELGRDWLVAGAERLEDYVLKTESRFRTSMDVLPERVALQQGAWRARLAAERTWREVPAYQHFLATHGVRRPNGNYHCFWYIFSAVRALYVVECTLPSGFESYLRSHSFVWLARNP